MPTDLEPRESRQRLHFVSDALAEPFRSLLDGNVSIAVDSVVHLDDGTHLQYWTVTGGSVENLLAAVEQFPTTLDARMLSTVGDTHRIETHGSSDSLFTAFTRFDGSTRSAVSDPNGVRITADFPLDVDRAAVAAAVREVYPDLALVAWEDVTTFDAVRRLVERALTDRQSTALRIAYYGGYYERPRQSTGAELAARMGITKQTFNTHLQKAYRTLFELLLADADYDDTDGSA
ncbi:bacterio-opsin activator domain-containing protein [Halomarina rubra]|uniref:Bacterio-opsin activator domain-containing protein n=1 Tax=Halomarina rubra TaxID=2071873 RepID=A0ABD6AZ54_9EURY|nr:bacterio-opsin activator domain-containing protein [Halomarina rubra]